MSYGNGGVKILEWYKNALVIRLDDPSNKVKQGGTMMTLQYDHK